MTRGLRWTIEDRDDLKAVKLSGSVDEDADLETLAKQVSGSRLRFDLSEVSRINSCGVREWVNFIRSLPESQTIEMEKCSPAVVSQINMISNFTGAATIISVQAPFACEECGSETNILVDTSNATVPSLEKVACPKCGETMEFDDLEESYFAFLN